LDLTRISSKIELKKRERERNEGEIERKWERIEEERENLNSIITELSPVNLSSSLYGHSYRKFYQLQFVTENIIVVCSITKN